MPEFIISVCTARRPLMLRACLESLTRLQILPDWRLRIVVIENDLTPRSAGVVDNIRRQTAIEIHYKLEPHIGIPFARNAAMDLASSLEPDWIALIDDDETAHPDWLLHLHDACVRFDADVAAGPVRRMCEVAAPAWWSPGRIPKDPTGTPLQGASTSNILMRASLVRKSGLAMRFDERLIDGSEDVEFFRRAHRNGAKIVWAADAWVDEFVPASRLDAKRDLSRSYMVAVSQAQVCQMHHGRFLATMLLIPKILRRTVTGATAITLSLLLWPVAPSKGRRLFHYGAARLFRALGHIAGCVGLKSKYYAVIDGR